MGEYKIVDYHKQGRSSRNKGAQGERELAKLLSDKLGLDSIKRGYVFCRESDVIGLKGIHIECKRVEKLNIENAMEQARNEAEKRKDGKPTLFHRRNRKGWLVTMDLDDWIELYRRGFKDAD
jgi:Holliday junction resolvase